MSSSHLRALCVGFVVAALVIGPAAAQALSPSRTRLLSMRNPSKAGSTVRLRAEVDGLGGGAPTGWVSFWDGSTTSRGYRLGYARLNSAGAGQQTLGVGYFYTCALTSAGGVKCWGSNTDGQLGDGTRIDRLTPVNVSGLTSGVVAISAGSGNTCALTTAGGVKCWGGNYNGQLGDGTTTLRLTPVYVSGLTSGVVAIAAGPGHTCALTTAGGVKCWGGNTYGQLGDGTTISRLTPVNVSGLTSGVVAIAAGCALTSAGGLKCWGRNNSGQLGDGTRIDRLTPVNVSGLTSGVVAITGGASHNCALTIAGGLKCWGFNHFGQVGDGTRINRLTPVDVSGLTSGVVAITARGEHTCALTIASGLKCWGDNSAGQLGDGTTAARLTPVNVSGLTSGVVAIAGGRWHTCALTGAGGLKCWGYNAVGQLGDGTKISRVTPIATLNLVGLLRARAAFIGGSLGAGEHMLRAVFGGDATHSGSYDRLPQTVE